MKEVPLIGGKVALVDDDDFELVKDFAWRAMLQGRRNKKWYAAMWVNGKYLAMHRLILNPPANREVGHKDGDGLNNQRFNLRAATDAQNAFNKGLSSHNRSGYKGVSFHTSAGKWQAGIYHNRRYVYLGLFENKDAAARAYDKEAKVRFGEYARLNFPEEASSNED